MPTAAQTSATANRFTRRRFLGACAVTGATLSVIPAHVLGRAAAQSANSKITLAGVGIGGVGYGQLDGCAKAGFEIVALCDVDDLYAAKAFKKWPQARRYRDFREMLQAESDRIDAVYIGTPDHTHAIITHAALKKKKHVCCVKPLTRTLHECRAITNAARQAGTATQVTAAPNTSESGCRTCELIWGGAIGLVREVHVWSNRPLWPQGMSRPPGQDPVPKTFDWDLWIGPAPQRPFKNHWPDDDLVLQQIAANRGKAPSSKGVYHPWNFRGWWDFGTGALGDMGCHHLNTVFRALKLKAPLAVQATSTRVMPEAPPLASIVSYDFPARADMPPLRLVWYDGGLRPPAPAEMGGRPLPEEGTLYLGQEGKMLGSSILTPERASKFENLPRTLPRRGGTWQEWFQACQGGEPAGCNFEWAGPLTETVLLGNVAIRSGRSLEWDSAQCRITNHEPANSFVTEAYHNGWKLEG